jgi:hypothetical protein
LQWAWLQTKVNESFGELSMLTNLKRLLERNTKMLYFLTGLQLFDLLGVLIGLKGNDWFMIIANTLFFAIAFHLFYVNAVARYKLREAIALMEELTKY